MMRVNIRQKFFFVLIPPILEAVIFTGLFSYPFAQEQSVKE
ncbi:MAG: hypothetical protein ACOX5R_16405 [bacterium]|jgi:hypothetical protein